MSSPNDQIVRYTVKKITEHHRLCSTCGGTGKTPGGSKCIECTNGVAVHWHHTEIDLLQALYEIGLIKKNAKESDTNRG